MTQNACGSWKWSVGQCDCGRVTLRLGQVTIELSPEEFSQLHRLIGQAMTELDISPATEPVLNDRATTH